MHCKSLWIKASAKCINVNVNVDVLGVERFSFFTVWFVSRFRYGSVCLGKTIQSNKNKENKNNLYNYKQQHK